MVSYDTNARLGDIINGIEQISDRVDQLIEVIKPEKELWDNADIIKNWKVSERTLADWRKKGLISYVQVQSKIWYPQDAREMFLRNNYVETKPDNGRAMS